MNNTFTAIDFETAHGKRWSICQIGLVRVENGIVTDTLNILVQPPGNEYHYMNTGIHGIRAAHTKKSPRFNKVWPLFQHYIHNQTVVAHNASFDNSCLKQALEYYNLPQPEYNTQCTLKLYGKALDILCREHKKKLNHHDALSDAMACAELYGKWVGSIRK